MSMMGELKFLLGIKIHQSTRGIFINQAKYAQEILKKHGMTSCDSIGTPMATKPLDADLSGTPVDQTKYLSMVGAAHMYLNYTSGEIQFLGGDKLVSRSSKKQDCTSMSLEEAEYVSLSACCAQVLWMRTQLTDYGFYFDKIPIYHFIKEHVKKGIVEVFFVRTEYQLVDLFTKALPEERFKYLVRRLDMRCLTPTELEVLEMDLFAFICYFDPTKVVVGERNVADRETKLLVSTKGRTIPLTPPALAASGDSGDSIDKLFDQGNDVEQERSTEKGDDVLEETIATDVLKIRLREDFHAATSDIGGKSLGVLRGLVLEDSSVSELNLQARPLVARSSVLDAPVVTVVATTTIDVDVSAILPPQVRVVSGRSASVGKAKKNVASTSKLDEPTTSSDSFYAAAARQMCVGAKVKMWAEHTLKQKNKFEDKCSEQSAHLLEKDAEIAHLRSLLSLKEYEAAEAIRLQYEAAEAIRLREQVSVVEVAATVKGDELRGLKERNFVLEGEKDLLSERAMTLESVTALKKKYGIGLDAKLLEMAAHLEEEFYPRFCPFSIWTGYSGPRWPKAGVDHGKTSISSCRPKLNALGECRFLFRSLTIVGSLWKDASMVDLMDSLRLEGPLAEIPGAEDLQPP
ncbi:retrovirus-related pol polyprotein from transposon TNT 1-94 [Tanacetum coccineum]|uniref:Retrovirus-related pol polyprotein from transposon TNT 1-94 n=1 Tax=Tanacetum coccineum TaxID=301880 RepID=A0ABQ5AUV5_9ASTR